jgi:hypothetical protein
MPARPASVALGVDGSEAWPGPELVITGVLPGTAPSASVREALRSPNALGCQSAATFIMVFVECKSRLETVVDKIEAIGMKSVGSEVGMVRSSPFLTRSIFLMSGVIDALPSSTVGTIRITDGRVEFIGVA